MEWKCRNANLSSRQSSLEFWKNSTPCPPARCCLSAVAETAAAVRDKWPVLAERDVVPAPVRERIDKHIDELTTIFDP